MTHEWKGIYDWEAYKAEFRLKEENFPANIYLHIHAHIKRIYRENMNHVYCAARELGCSENTVRKYLRFVTLRQLKANSSLADRFDWRTLDVDAWKRLLRKHPQFRNRVPRHLITKVLPNMGDEE